jgi:hypothetical protein
LEVQRFVFFMSVASVVMARVVIVVIMIFSEALRAEVLG